MFTRLRQRSRAPTRYLRLSSVALGALVSLLLVNHPESRADEPSAETEIFAIARGGLLYDKWWAVMEMDEPTASHPAYPAAGKKQGAASWRCKECHGWDYKGAAGAYGKGSHYSGIKGIRDMVGADPRRIAAILRAAPHSYSKGILSEKALRKIALFVSRGQIDMDQYIERATKKARGDAARGARLYQTICAICHGFDGKAINFKDENKPEFIGTVASENPWETLHKIRNGQPGVAMVALGALSIQDQVDLLAYTQTLPAN